MPKSSLNVTAVWTRDIDSRQKDGRMGILTHIQETLSEAGTLTEIRQQSVMERHGRFIGVLAMLWAVFSEGLKGRPLPLQCALFSGTKDLAKQVLETQPDLIVLDSIRQIELLSHIRRRDPGIPVVLDMDDLMSRRFALLIENSFLPSLGEYSKKLPRVFAHILKSKGIATVIMSYERRALEHAEAIATNLSNKVVLVSMKEAELVRAAYPEVKDRIHSITPPVIIPENVVPFSPQGKDLKFAFIGSDKMVQNATAIDELLKLWASEKPKQELLLYGKLTRTYDELPKNVVLCGFVDRISDVYDGRTVLFAPTRLAGGVKTKFLEAFAYGAPVIGSELTFEGVPPSPAYIQVEDLLRDGILFEEQELLSILESSARKGEEIVRSHYASGAFRRKWADLIASTVTKT